MKSKARITAKNFIKIVEWSDEDQCYIGSAPPLIGRCCHGDDEAKVMKELAQIVAEWIEIYKNEGWLLPGPTAGREYSGKFVFRTTPAHHRALALQAYAAGQSLNAYCAQRLAESPAPAKTAVRRPGARVAAKQRRAIKPRRTSIATK